MLSLLGYHLKIVIQWRGGLTFGGGHKNLVGEGDFLGGGYEQVFGWSGGLSSSPQ